MQQGFSPILEFYCLQKEINAQALQTEISDLSLHDEYLAFDVAAVKTDFGVDLCPYPEFAISRYARSSGPRFKSVKYL